MPLVPISTRVDGRKTETEEERKRRLIQQILVRIKRAAPPKPLIPTPTLKPPVPPRIGSGPVAPSWWPEGRPGFPVQIGAEAMVPSWGPEGFRGLVPARLGAEPEPVVPPWGPQGGVLPYAPMVGRNVFPSPLNIVRQLTRPIPIEEMPSAEPPKTLGEIPEFLMGAAAAWPPFGAVARIPAAFQVARGIPLAKQLAPAIGAISPRGYLRLMGVPKVAGAAEEVVGKVIKEPSAKEIKHWVDTGNTLPVARALAKLDRLDLIAKVEGHSKPGGLVPFSVRLKTGEYLTRPSTIKARAVAEWDMAKSIKPPVAREPWQMTKTELFESERQKIRVMFPKWTKRDVERQMSPGAISDAHREMVRDALSEGKTIPPKVLKEYPELARPAPGVVKEDIFITGARAKAEAEMPEQLAAARQREMGLKPPIRPVGKDAWKLTLDQYIAKYGRKGQDPGIQRAFFGMNHRAHIEKALAEGKPVSPKVLADYPELARTVPKAEAVKPSIFAPTTVSREALQTAADDVGARIKIFDIESAERQQGYRFKIVMPDGSEHLARNNADGMRFLVAKPAPQVVEVFPSPAVAEEIPPFKPLTEAKYPSAPPPAGAEAPSVPPPAGVELLGEGIIPPGRVPPGVVEPPLEVVPPGKPLLMGDLSDFGQTIEIAQEPDIARRIANLPVMRTIFGTLNPSAVADTSVKQALIGRAMLRAEGQTKATGVFANLEALGKQNKIFGPLDTEGRLSSGPLKGLVLNDIRTYPQRYAKQLTEAQKRWIEMANTLEKEKFAFLKRNGIEIRELSFEEGGQYAGRRVFAKLSPEGELLDTGFVSAGPGRPGAKLTAEKTRVFKTAEEAIKEGFRYLPEEDTLSFNLTGAYNRVADKKMVEWLLENIDWRTTKAPLQFVEKAEKARRALLRSRQLQAGLNRAVRGERLPDATISSIAEDFPQEAKTLKALVKRIQGGEETASAVQTLDTEAKSLMAQSQVAFHKAVAERAVAAEEAARLKFGEARVAAPAFAGKILTGPDALETARLINKSFTPEFNKAVGAINKVNALGRFFQLAGDASPFTIQLIFLAGENPKIYGKVGIAFARTLFDSAFHAKYLAKHGGTIQKATNLILAKSGTEFTEAMARGGLLRWGPFKIAGKVLEPFQRGFEVALDVAGIEMREAFDYLATTPSRAAQVEAFINEFRGLANSARLGVSPLWRQVETASLLAPRYNRAIAALVTDIFRGNLRGELARGSLAKGIAAIAAMAVAISYARGESSEEIAEHFNPTTPSKFFTWKVGGQNVGPGSKVRSLIVLWAKLAKDPEKAAEISLFNPLARFMRGNLAPVPSDSLDFLTGRNYIGDPTREGVLSFAKTIAAPSLMPIWIESMALEGGDITGRTTRGAVEFLGGRAYPRNLIWELRDEWKPDIEPYNALPTNTQEARDKKVMTRLQYRQRNPLVDAKLFIMGEVESLQTPPARSEALRLMRENKLKIQDIHGLQPQEYESLERKQLRAWLEKYLGVEVTPARAPARAPVPTPTPTQAQKRDAAIRNAIQRLQEAAPVSTPTPTPGGR